MQNVNGLRIQYIGRGPVQKKPANSARGLCAFLLPHGGLETRVDLVSRFTSAFTSILTSIPVQSSPEVVGQGSDCRGASGLHTVSSFSGVGVMGDPKTQGNIEDDTDDGDPIVELSLNRSGGVSRGDGGLTGVTGL